jgi:hypothetical protein
VNIDSILCRLTSSSEKWTVGYIGTGGIGPIAFVMDRNTFPLLRDIHRRPFLYPFTGVIEAVVLIEEGIFFRANEWREAGRMFGLSREETLSVIRAEGMMGNHDRSLRTEILIELGIYNKRISLETRPEGLGGKTLSDEDRTTLFAGGGVDVSLIFDTS